MSALASEVGTGAVSPPEVETCIRIECPLRCSEKYSRAPSVTRERFDVPSFVICSDEITAGGDSGDLVNQKIATNTATATSPNATHFTTFALGRDLGVATAANIARNLSFESGTCLGANPTVTVDPDSIPRRRRCKSPRISAAL